MEEVYNKAWYLEERGEFEEWKESSNRVWKVSEYRSKKTKKVRNSREKKL